LLWDEEERTCLVLNQRPIKWRLTDRDINRKQFGGQEAEEEMKGRKDSHRGLREREDASSSP